MRQARKRIVLHVGMPKTGTTSIQAMLRENGERLLEVGIWYPGAELHPRLADSPNHRAFFCALTGVYRPRSGMADLGECQALLENAVGSFSVDASLDAFIISHEELAARCQALDQSILSGLQDEFDIVVVLYVRPMREWVESRYSQFVMGRAIPSRAQGEKKFKSISNSIMRRVDRSLPSSIVKNLQRALPRAKIDVRSFVLRRRNNDLLSNFVETTMPAAASVLSKLDADKPFRNSGRQSCVPMFLYHLQLGGAGPKTAHEIERAMPRLSRVDKNAPPPAEKTYYFLSDEEFVRLEALDRAEAELFPDLALDAPVTRKSGAASELTRSEFHELLEWLRPHISPAAYQEAARSYGVRG